MNFFRIYVYIFYSAPPRKDSVPTLLSSLNRYDFQLATGPCLPQPVSHWVICFKCGFCRGFPIRDIPWAGSLAFGSGRRHSIRLRFIVVVTANYVEKVEEAKTHSSLHQDFLSYGDMLSRLH